MKSIMEIIGEAMEPYNNDGTCCKMTLKNLRNALSNITTQEISNDELIKAMEEKGFTYKFYWSEIDKLQVFWLVKMKDSNALI